MTIPLDIDGRILNASLPEHFVRVADDRANTGGFLVYERWNGSNGPNESGAFDSWVQSEEALEHFFAESKWTIEWNLQ